MADDNRTLKELMEEIRQQNEPATDPDFFSEDFWDESDPEEPKINLEVCIAQTLESMEAFRLTQEEQSIIKEFLTFRVQTNHSTRPEARQAYYNLLIHGDEAESIRRFAHILRGALDIRFAQTAIFKEADLLRMTESLTRTSRKPLREQLIPQGIRFLLIDECQDAPRISLDGGGTTRDASKKAIAMYTQMWQTVLEYARQHPEMTLIVAGSEDVYRNTLRPFNHLSQRICSHHIRLAPRGEDELLADCLGSLRNSSFALAPEFEEALAVYFHTTYRASDLEGQAYVEDLKERIFSRYYSQTRNEAILTADCVPPCDLQLQSVETILARMDALVGLEAVKTEFRNIYKMQIAGLANRENTRYHMLFTGNPGTGKTTVAQMAADLFFRMGIIKTNKMISVKPCDLISEWIGGTGTKAMEVIHRAYNGVLFIDEAYGIANMDRGHELLNVLMQEMENHADKLVVILAGYTDEMRELLKANPGLGSRIGQEIHFDDYSLEELCQIFHSMCKKDGFSMDPAAQDELEDCINGLMTKEFFGNARDVRNLLQDLKEAWSNDYYEQRTQGNLAEMPQRIFLPQHFETIMPPKKEGNIQDLIGLEVLKNKLETFKRQAMYQRLLQEKGFRNLSDFSLHMIFTGNPGTGKTTVAKLIADDLYSIGMLKTNRLVVAERKDLISAYGDTARKTADVIRKAVGGVLFVDEAYSLAGNRHGGSEAIEVFLTAMEEHKSDTVFIFAGYVDEMQEFLAMNPGIASRIGYTFHFDDYSPEELTRMYAEKMQKTGFIVAEDALDRVREIMEYFQDVKNFGNGRFVNHVIHQTISQRAAREFTTNYRQIQAQDVPTIKTLIETAPNGMHLYDPAEITPEDQRRTAIHELGHAVVMVGCDPNNLPESISIRSHAGSYGRVRISNPRSNQTEQELLNHLAVLLGGKNAEKHLLGTHSTGCASDYVRAKRLAEDMVERFAMTTFGANAAEILKAADELSAQMIEKHLSVIAGLTPKLLEQKVLTGEELKNSL